MGIASFSPQFSRMAALSIVASPIQAFFALFMPSGQAAQGVRPLAVRPAPCGSITRRGQPPGSLAGRREGQGSLCTHPENGISAKPSRLKIVRQFEPGVSSALAGRMVISGRMADVCAELDRMEQRESAAAQIPMF